jgi:hypothetical protein
MTPFIPRPWAILCIVLFPGILGFIGASHLCGIGMCGFVPLTPTAIALPAFVAVVTVLLSRWCDVVWVVAPAVYSVPMLAPIGIAATSVAEEWLRLVIALLCVLAPWVGARMLQPRRPLPKESGPTPVVS